MQGNAEKFAGNAPRASRDSFANREARPAEGAPDSQLLASLDVLERWDMLNGDDVDLLLSTLPTADEALLDFQDTNEAPAKDKEPERPSKG